MTPFQIFYLVFSLVAFALAWLRGGHPERAAAAALIVTFIASYILYPLRLGELRLGEPLADLVLLAVLIRLSLKYDRWSLLALTGFMALTMVVHVAVLVSQGGIGPRTDIAARWGLGVLMICALIGGVIERWLAGERPVSEVARWGTVRRS